MGRPHKEQPSLFRAFRALGYITDSVPFSVQRRGKETYVTVSVGKAWQVYNTAKLTLVLVGPQLHGSICALASKGDLTFAAVGSTIVECKRVHKTGQYAGHKGQIIQMLVMGEHLISLSVNGQLCVWKIGDHSQPQNVIDLPAGFQPRCMTHPDTYLNKLVIGSQGGQLLLLNFVTGKVLYTFNGYGSAVCAVVPSPALDVVGVALADGRAALLNLKFDETLVVFKNAAGVGMSSGLLISGSDSTAQHATGGGAAAGLGSCTTLAFRTGAGVPLMAAGGGAGVITVWNLEDRKLHAVIPDAHDASLVALHFFAGEPLLMSSGADNAVKHWVFDSAQPQPRLLRFRSGHAAPPTVVVHYGEGLRLLTAGSDRAFRVFSTIQDQQSRELSQKHMNKRAKRLKVRDTELKLARVVAVDAGTVRERDWANVITAHEGDPTAYVWRLAHFTLGEHELRPPQLTESTPSTNGRLASTPGGRVGAPVTAVALSSCGNFGIVGSASGRIDRYNMQSGIHRGCYARMQQQPVSPAQPQQPAQIQIAAHDASVTGIRVDSCNRLMVTAGLDGYLRVWDFKKQQFQYEVAVGSPVTHIAMSGGSALVAIAADDLMLRCYDIEADGRLVRRFKGHRDRITCLQLSSDGRWLLSSSMDGSLRVWDVPAAQCLQVLRLGAPVTSFSLGPAQDMLATCHVNRRGVYLWSNQAVFGNPADFIHSESPVDVALPTIASGHERDQKQQTDQQMQGKITQVRIAGTAVNPELGSGSDSEEEEEADVNMQSEEKAEANVSDEDEGYSDIEDSRGVELSETEHPDSTELEVPWQQRNPETGEPTPIAPSLITLSLLPRSQWHSLLYLETIKARNRPTHPPSKPEAAPFFLPTVAGVEGGVVFDTQATTNTEQAPEAKETDTTGSRILKVQPGKGSAGLQDESLLSEFVRLLRAGAETGDFSSFTAYLRGLSPAALDREVRALQLLTAAEVGQDDHEDETSAAAVHDIASLLEVVNTHIAAGTNFEFCTALLQLLLQVHGDAIMERPVLHAAAARVYKRLRPVWDRLNNLLSDVRCMTAYFGNLQG